MVDRVEEVVPNAEDSMEEGTEVGEGKGPEGGRETGCLGRGMCTSRDQR